MGTSPPPRRRHLEVMIGPVSWLAAVTSRLPIPFGGTVAQCGFLGCSQLRGQRRTFTGLPVHPTTTSLVTIDSNTTGLAHNVF